MIAVALLAPATASAATDWATVTGYAAGGSDNNHPDTWGADLHRRSAGPGRPYVLKQDWDLVIVKAGSEESAPGHVNTLFANATAGQTVWADSNGDGTFDQGDKGISHIIFCGPSDEETSTPTATRRTPHGNSNGHPDRDPTDTPRQRRRTRRRRRRRPRPERPAPTATPTDTPTATPTEPLSINATLAALPRPDHDHQRHPLQGGDPADPAQVQGGRSRRHA